MCKGQGTKKGILGVREILGSLGFKLDQKALESDDFSQVEASCTR